MLPGRYLTRPPFSNANEAIPSEQSMTVDINLSDLVNALGLGSLNLSNLDVTDLLNQIGLGDLDLSGLDLSNLTLSDLLGDLGVGDLASISVDPFGGLITELVDIVPSQILAAL
jgi:hypothetical protein